AEPPHVPVPRQRQRIACASPLSLARMRSKGRAKNRSATTGAACPIAFRFELVADSGRAPRRPIAPVFPGEAEVADRLGEPLEPARILVPTALRELDEQDHPGSPRTTAGVACDRLASSCPRVLVAPNGRSWRQRYIPAVPLELMATA